MFLGGGIALRIVQLYVFPLNRVRLSFAITVTRTVIQTLWFARPFIKKQTMSALQCYAHRDMYRLLRHHKPKHQRCHMIVSIWQLPFWANVTNKCCVQSICKPSRVIWVFALDWKAFVLWLCLFDLSKRNLLKGVKSKIIHY